MRSAAFLVSLPYLNTNGVVAPYADVKAELVSRAATLADELNVLYLETPARGAGSRTRR